MSTKVQKTLPKVAEKTYQRLCRCDKETALQMSVRMKTTRETMYGRLEYLVGYGLAERIEEGATVYYRAVKPE